MQSLTIARFIHDDDLARGMTVHFRMFTKLFSIAALGIGALGFWCPVDASEPVIYEVYQPLDLGNGGGPPLKDYYVNLGVKAGITKGMLLKVYRRAPSFDVLHERAAQEVTFPIAMIKVIHVEPLVSIARIEKMLSPAEVPSAEIQAVMVGDLIQMIQK